MTDTTTVPKPAAGTATAYEKAKPLAECSALADPTLIEQHRALLAWPATIAHWNELPWVERFGQEPPALPRYAGKSVGSPQMVQETTLDAEADIDRDVRARLADGRLRILAFQEPRELADEPVLLPVALVATAVVRWRRGTIAGGGMSFVEAQVISAEDLPDAEQERLPDDATAPEPEPEPVPPATLGRLVEVLVALFHEERSWAVASTADLAKAVAARDRRFQPHQGPAKAGRWSEATLHQRIRECRVEARAEAGL